MEYSFKNSLFKIKFDAAGFGGGVLSLVLARDGHKMHRCSASASALARQSQL